MQGIAVYEVHVTIDILCKVVDNYGDIGVVYRLARALSDLDAGLELRLIVDDLRAFKALEPAIDETAAVQTVRGWTVAAAAPGAPELFRARRPRFVVECFACGRPDWYEEILFDPDDPVPRLIVNLEYLSAEDYAIELHKAPSLTRSSLVRKAMFLPGFCKGTGGLIIDRRFAALLRDYDKRARRPVLRRRLAERLGLAAPEGSYWVSVFTYERSYAAIVRDLAAAREAPIFALAAPGRSAAPFADAWAAAGRPFPLAALPFLPQETWDEVLLASDLAIVRGEESLARAALSGRPFLWHAYLQEDGWQIVKVRALLERMRPFFAPEAFEPIERTFVAFNERTEDDASAPGADDGFAAFLEGCRTERGRAGFEAFAGSIRALGDLAGGLLTFMRDFG